MVDYKVLKKADVVEMSKSLLDEVEMLNEMIADLELENRRIIAEFMALQTSSKADMDMLVAKKEAYKTEAESLRK